MLFADHRPYSYFRLYHRNTLICLSVFLSAYMKIMLVKTMQVAQSVNSVP